MGDTGSALVKAMRRHITTSKRFFGITRPGRVEAKTRRLGGPVPQSASGMLPRFLTPGKKDPSGRSAQEGWRVLNTYGYIIPALLSSSEDPAATAPDSNFFPRHAFFDSVVEKPRKLVNPARPSRRRRNFQKQTRLEWT
jgi:hypothetical protein